MRPARDVPLSAGSSPPGETGPNRHLPRLLVLALGRRLGRGAEPQAPER
jgi:hypothetical protein